MLYVSEYSLVSVFSICGEVSSAISLSLELFFSERLSLVSPRAFLICISSSSVVLLIGLELIF